jgi:hypothetical protein
MPQIDRMEKVNFHLIVKKSLQNAHGQISKSNGLKRYMRRLLETLLNS